MDRNRGIQESGRVDGKDAWLKLAEAVSFASRAHDGQTRKDGRTPYASHPFRVCLTLRHVFGVEDERVLTAALLHDVIEDTTTDYDAVEKQFGPDVAKWVGLMSKDKRLPLEEREERYRSQLASAPDEVKLIKLADVHDNVLDSGFLRDPEKVGRSIDRTAKYVEAIRPGAKGRVATALAVVDGLIQTKKAQIASNPR